MKFKTLSTIIFLLLSTFSLNADYSSANLSSTEGDPDGFIGHCVNVITGDYCEAVTDLSIIGPDALQLQRFYNSTNYVTGKNTGGWRIFPQQFLVLGKSKNEFGKIYAFTGERSGGILTYSGTTDKESNIIEPLKIDLLNDGKGIANTFSGEISGQTNRLNNKIDYKGEACELVLGDGTKRLYIKVKRLPTLLLGEEIIPSLANQINQPEYFQLTQETLPSGNHICFSYDLEGHLANVEIKNNTHEKIHSWLKFEYEPLNKGYIVKILTSDDRKLEYSFSKITLENGLETYVLSEIEGSHHSSCTYQYQINGNFCLLTKKTTSCDRFIEVEYDNQGRVNLVNEPHHLTGKPTTTFNLTYKENSTEVTDNIGVTTRYKYNKNSQLTSIEQFDSQGHLFKKSQKIWGFTSENCGFLLAKFISDGNESIKSYCRYQYDSFGNVLEKQIFGNLSGKEDQNICLDLNHQLINEKQIENHKTTFTYSKDGFNLLKTVGENPKIQTEYSYKPGTNLCTKELTREQYVKKRILRKYNDDAVCVQIIEDDGFNENESKLEGVKERYITTLNTKTHLPGVGLTETFTQKAFNVSTNQEMLIKKQHNTFNNQGNLLSCATYDSNEELAYIEHKYYNLLGYLISEINFLGIQYDYTYDCNGNRMSVLSSHDNKLLQYTYNYKNQIVKTVETLDNLMCLTENFYDEKGRKISSKDRFGNLTSYSYDDFGRLTKVHFPEVYDENNQIAQPTFNYISDIFGNVIKVTDPKGYVTLKNYNLNGQVTNIIHPDGSTEIFKYFLEGDLHRTISRDKIYTSFEYDSQKRLLCKNRLSYKDQKPGDFVDTLEYKYNSFHCQEIDNCSLIKTYKYDSCGRPLSIIEKDKSNKDIYHQGELTYDSLGRISQKKVWFGDNANDYSIEKFEYDLAGNIITKLTEDATKKILLQRKFVYDLNGKCTEEYGLSNNQLNLITKTTYNGMGEPIAYTDAVGNITNILIDYDYINTLGQKVTKKTISDPFKTQTEIEFDALGRIISIVKKNNHGEILSSQQLQYDLCGNKCAEIHDQVYEGKITGSQISRWVYGPLGRLEEEIESCGTLEEKTVKYSYNNLGQLVEKTVPGFASPLVFTYSGAGKIESVKFSDNTLPKDQQIFNFYYYDDRGNMIKCVNKLNGTYCERIYNSLNKMTSEKILMGSLVYTSKYYYDRKGRIRKIILPDKSSIIYDFDAVFCNKVTRVSAKGETLYSHYYNDYDQNGKLLSETLAGLNQTREYSYDLNDKLVKISFPFLKNNDSVKYDTLGRLVQLETERESFFSNSSFNYSALSQLTEENSDDPKKYTYDSLDNRLSVNHDQLVYNSLNQLKSYSDKYFYYDLQGNLIKQSINNQNTVYESNILSELIKIELPDQNKLLYSYDPIGRRFLKKHSSSDGKKIFSCEQFLFLDNQEIGTLNEKGEITQLRIPGINGENISSKSIAIELKGKYYIPLHGTNDSVTALIDPISAKIIESYEYTPFGEETIFDSFGNSIKASSVENPWRYAEKRTDKESGLVFFGRRYYNPQIGRWISPDPLGKIDGPNLYAYLHNQPTKYCDQFGLATETPPSSYDSYIHGDKEYIHHSWGIPPKDYHLSYTRKVNRGGNTCILPKITYNDNFENSLTYYSSESDFWNTKDLYDSYRPYYERSKVYDLNLPELNNLGIGFINGINNTFQDAQANAHHLSRLAGGCNIHAVHNATHGIGFDIIECKMGLNYIATEPVRQLHKMWNNYFNQASQESRFLMICHSQGAIHVRNALLDYPEHLRNRIIVVAIAPAAYIYQQSCAQVVHYCTESTNDLVPRFDQLGRIRAKDTIVELKSDLNASMWDHDFMSPTYQEQLQLHIKNYINSQGKML